jgi:hypothetical protein
MSTMSPVAKAAMNWPLVIEVAILTTAVLLAVQMLT